MLIVRRNGRTDPKLIDGGNPSDLEEGKLYEVSNMHQNGADAAYELVGVKGRFPACWFTRVAVSMDAGQTIFWLNSHTSHQGKNYIMMY